MNTATDYQTGIEMHFEWELAEHLPFGLSAGVGGYLYQQLTGDSGSGADLGPFIGRVASVGPVLSYTFKSGEQQVTLSALPYPPLPRGFHRRRCVWCSPGHGWTK